MIEPDDVNRLGTIFQSHTANGVDSILVAEGEQASDFNAIEIIANGVLYEDILPPRGQIWAKAGSGTPTLTIVLKY